MKKIVSIFFIIISLAFNYNISYANEYKQCEVVNISNNDYSVSAEIINLTEENNNQIYTGLKLKNYSLHVKAKYKNENIILKYNWQDENYTIKDGEQIIKFSFIDYKNSKTVVNCEIILFGIQKPIVKDESDAHSENWGKNENTKIVEEVLPTTLTASTILLSTLDSSYDINLNNKPETEATYTWSSSNTKVAKVNSKGIVTSVAEGKTTITCKVETADETQSLKANVIVGGDNVTQLTDTELELEVGDLFDVDVDNGVKGSKYRWISSNKSVAKVISTNGKITALSLGSATITCTISNKTNIIVLKCDVNVVK